MAINSYLLALLICVSYQAASREIPPNLTVRSWSNAAQSVTTAVPTSKSFFNSRLEYSNKWLPVGRSDPLKNDPTYDYSPPTIDHRIHYWDEKSTKTNGNKNEILLLGVSSRRQYNHNYVQRPSDISTVMLPPPIQSVQKISFKSEKSPNRPSHFGAHNKWQDAVSSESNVRPTIVFPNAAPTIYDHKLNSNADDVNKLLSHTDIHSSMYTKSSQSKKSWLQDLLQKEVARPTSPPSPHVQIEALTMHKLDDINRYKTEMSTEYYIEVTPPYFVPTIQPSIAKENQFLFKEMPKPMNPMNLIIQGHSRVKTYGQGADERDPKIIEVKGVENPVVNRVVSKDENGVQFDVKHLHAISSNKTVSTHVNSTVESGNSSVAGLLSLLDLSFGDILSDNSPDVVNRTKLQENKVL
ncbi:uncharacterized protein LOC119076924 [Bradysia coprophila]|uniref:uncharacterized protein LOC119076924 n=1 Tax=Bradysia coprophila TaxID=38358 RepID=UPI00187DA0E9|nr:uncharacterized protein LOC119076924 [Bradysia coprophila]XP_037039844.1 uncharacterized protein LOC119076924 [Bradysia coprophila]